MPKDVVITGL